jgi:prophage antirepressor-like protein
MSNNQLTFNFVAQSVRIVMIDDVPWFVAADICKVLSIANNRDAIARLDDDERGVGIIDTSSGQQEMGIINESGLYSLILTSRKPEAKAFKKWVTSEVLPALRQHGQYRMVGATDSALITMTQKQLTDLIERCIERGVGAALRVSTTVTESIRPHTTRENFSEWEKVEILRLNKLGVSALEIAELLYRPVSSIRGFLWRNRRGVSQ